MRNDNRKPVFLTDDNGMVIKRYNDAGEAGKDLGMARSGVQYHCVNKTSRNLRYEDDINEEMPSREVWCKYCKRYSASELANASVGWCIKRTILFELKKIVVGRGNPNWGAPTDKDVFIIKFYKEDKQ